MAAESSSEAAWSTRRWTIAGIIAVILTFLASFWAVQEAQRATKVTRENGILERRPWLKFKAEFPEIRESDHGLHIRAHFEIENVGLSPAVNILIRERHIIGPLRFLPESKEFLAEVKRSGTQANKYAVFPNDTTETNECFLFDDGKDDRATFAGGKSIAISILYRSTESEEWFNTTEFYGLSKSLSTWSISRHYWGSPRIT